MSTQSVTDDTEADHVRQSLDGAHTPVLQRQLYLLWQQADATQLRLLLSEEMANALVYMRRTGHARYDARAHACTTDQEKQLLATRMTETVRRTAFGAGTSVRVLGEPNTGIITHAILGHDYDSPYPAVWYVVAAPLRRLCRAHGADEIEEAFPQGNGTPRIRPQQPGDDGRRQWATGRRAKPAPRNDGVT
ncbi:hypothetical protein OG413_27990 [Streptomyces sp. NBC_01433]|uniref:hypothetical protein n=1 Tax=Streptomyces sp. NBC_01433 TaxID=2903864 RepID=UPI00225BDA4D|nr:hypothetical protein [Streptomyces sp. NBC_01433]MCX4679100.1 hypothetical protein [Streptomyces sp. NBC_01433]